ncbi:trna 2 -phosphotransferase tpt1 [Moniliophthora roreri MCA 2997]|uniref:2'-phosphotransferase n=2 Tax=Moniliophthora roreri TaxID=221103 RepID=V2WKM0_MONRO|nr:trna 2 -phosphotransferase tpt1 [Moniliophthora roreri MCA 2997]KAI3619614.1 trna 2-phosphotransferase tpt1 [Moniliophthora roreri]
MHLVRHVLRSPQRFTRNTSYQPALGQQKYLKDRATPQERIRKPAPNHSKPQPTDVATATITRQMSWLLRHAAQSQGIRIRPDGYVRVNDLLSYYLFKRYNMKSLQELLRYDPKHRFEFKEEEGLWRGSKEWLVRHQGGHTIKGVSSSAKRITSFPKSSAAIYCTDIQRWKTFSEHGIWSERGDELIHLVRKVPEYEGIEAFNPTVRILISIDVEKAMHDGDIMFYKINDGSLVTDGDKRGCITPEYFKEVVAVTWNNEVLVDQLNRGSNPEQEALS